MRLFNVSYEYANLTGTVGVELLLTEDDRTPIRRHVLAASEDTVLFTGQMLGKLLNTPLTKTADADVHERLFQLLNADGSAAGLRAFVRKQKASNILEALASAAVDSIPEEAVALLGVTKAVYKESLNCQLIPKSKGVLPVFEELHVEDPYQFFKDCVNLEVAKKILRLPQKKYDQLAEAYLDFVHSQDDTKILEALRAVLLATVSPQKRASQTVRR